MPELTGLPGVKRKIVPCKMVRTITAALTVTRKVATTAANYNGAINVWIDDAGDYRAEFCRYLRTKGGGAFKIKSALRDWLREWWPKMSVSYIPSSATPQAGLEPRKRNGGEQ